MCCSFAANAVRLQLHALAYNLGNFMRTLALPETVKHWSLTSLREKLVKIGAKIVTYEHYTYRVSWSQEDGELVATCAEFPACRDWRPIKSTLCAVSRSSSQTWLLT